LKRVKVGRHANWRSTSFTYVYGLRGKALIKGELAIEEISTLLEVDKIDDPRLLLLYSRATASHAGFPDEESFGSKLTVDAAGKRLVREVAPEPFQAVVVTFRLRVEGIYANGTCEAACRGLKNLPERLNWGRDNVVREVHSLIEDADWYQCTMPPKPFWETGWPVRMWAPLHIQ